MIDPRQIHPLTAFLRNHKIFIGQLKQTRLPQVFTVNGKAAVVVLDPESYQAMTDKVAHLETLEAIKQGLAAAERGEMKPANQVFAEMKAKYGL